MKSSASMRPTAIDLCVRHNDISLLPNGRTNCPKCTKRSQWYCSTCFVPTIDESLIPSVKLPIRVDVLRGREEKDSKSTAAHIAVMSKEDTTLWRLPDFPKYKDPSKVLLLYPSPTSIPASSIKFEEYEALIVVDTTWNKASGVMQLPELAQPFQHVHLDDYHTLFWRYQPLGPACLSTIEALYFFFRDALIGKNSRESGIARKAYQLEDKEGQENEDRNGEKGADTSTAAEEGKGEVGKEGGNAGNAPELPIEEKSAPKSDPDAELYDGRYDNLLYFFLAQYSRIQFEYTAGKKKGHTFTNKMRENYIKEGSSSEDTPKDKISRKPIKDQPRRARVKGGWSVRTDVMSENVAQVHEEINSRFLSYGKNKKRKVFEKLNGIVEEKGSDVEKGLVAYTVISEQRHKYGTILGMTKEYTEEEVKEFLAQQQREMEGKEKSEGEMQEKLE